MMHGIIFAYRANKELRELVESRTTSSIPYGARYRMIDFMLSNMVSAGIRDVGVIMREHYQSLLDHLGSGKDWDLSRKRGGLKLLPPFAYARALRLGERGVEYRGAMDALAGIHSYLLTIRQPYVVLAGGDVIATLPLEEVLESHIRSKADITAVCGEGPYSRNPRESTFFMVGENGFVSNVLCAPKRHSGLEALDVYILSKEKLLELTEYCAGHDLYDFERDVLANMNERINPWIFGGVGAKVRSVQGYFEQSMALLNSSIRESLFNRERPVRTKERSDVSTYYGDSAVTENSLIADGCFIEGEVRHSILFRGVRIARGAKVENCILMQDSRIGRDSTLRYVIADKDVKIGSSRKIVGDANYPVAISKGSKI